MKIGKFVHKKSFLIVVAIIVVAGVVSWQYSGTAEFCAICHTEKPYYDSWKSGQYLDHAHEEKGITCDDCHVPPGQNRIMQIPTYMKEGFDYVRGDYDTPFPEANLSKEYCLKCHGTYDELAQKTVNVKPNPHQSHLGEIQCQLCHKSHKPFQNYCAKCHKWNFERQASTSKGLQNLNLPGTSSIGWLMTIFATVGVASIIWTNRKEQS